MLTGFTMHNTKWCPVHSGLLARSLFQFDWRRPWPMEWGAMACLMWLANSQTDICDMLQMTCEHCIPANKSVSLSHLAQDQQMDSTTSCWTCHQLIYLIEGVYQGLAVWSALPPQPTSTPYLATARPIHKHWNTEILDNLSQELVNGWSEN